MEVEKFDEIEDIKFLEDNSLVDPFKWKFFNENVDFTKYKEDQFTKNNGLTITKEKFEKAFQNEKYQQYLQFQALQKFAQTPKLTPSLKSPDVVKNKKRVYAKFTIEFTTETQTYYQGSFEMQDKILVIGNDPTKKSHLHFLNLSPYFKNMRPMTKNFIARKHLTIMFDEVKNNFVLVNHCRNGALVNLFLVVNDPFVFEEQNVYEIRLGDIKMNHPITSFTYNTINVKAQFFKSQF